MIEKKVLIIDDDADVRRINEKVFGSLGAVVTVATNGSEGIRCFFLEKPDLVITDIMMPEMDGFEVCRRIRQVSSVPIMMLTALNSEEEIIGGLDSGADDFISKPFSPDILVARAKALLRRFEMPKDSTVRHNYYSDGYLTIDLEKRNILVRGDSIKLTRTEYNLLAYLFQNSVGSELLIRSLKMYGGRSIKAVWIMSMFISPICARRSKLIRGILPTLKVNMAWGIGSTKKGSSS